MYEQLAEAERARKRNELAENRARLRQPKRWVAGGAASLMVGGGYEAVAAALGDGDFTVMHALAVAAITFGVEVLATLVSAVGRS